VPAFIQDYKRYITSISKTFELRIFCQISEAWFIEGNYEEALEWINKAINATPSAFRDDVVSGIKMHELFTHLELDNIRLLKSRITAASKYLRTKKKPFKLENYIIAFMQEFIGATSPEDRIGVLTSGRMLIEKIFRDRSETIPLKYIYLRAWFESKSENQPLKKVLKKELQRYRLEEREKYQAIS
jgi:tetratricopeptide (TPR) repeat protein